ncbi:CaiB/BaiF CoA transferase family protein [Aeromicrobium phragmitis]|uniref:CaiB/BaiF CoA transferase family protein n=1 Tax=Aeromicrobium phragmitis TaxID=2478914 RepID=UPI00140CD59A|nr:CoA transferase [Aeromicrobium phragmitis]
MPDTPEGNTGPLAGVRIVDLTSYFMGPYATALLAQLGASVTKVEPPEGDISRGILDPDGRRMGQVFLNLNRGKSSVVLNLKSPADFRLFEELTATTDVVIHNIRQDSAERLGISYERLRRVNPSVILCSLQGFASDGPLASRPALDDTIQAASGMASIQGGSSGEPAYIRSPIADKTVGVFAVVAVLAAIIERDRSGLGQSVEVPMLETMTSFNLVEQQGGLVYDPPRGPSGYARTASPFRRPFRTTDGHISVLVYTNRHWADFFRLIDRDDLVEDERFRTIGARTENIDELYRLIGSEFLNRSSQDWLERLQKADIPCAPVATIDDIVASERTTPSGLLERVDHPTEGTLLQPALPIRFSRTALAPAAPAPNLRAVP